MADPLFGAGIKANTRWISNLTRASEAGFWASARTIPRTAAIALGMAWKADRQATIAAGLAYVIQAAAGALSLLAVNTVLVELLAARITADRIRAVLPALGLVLGLAICSSLCRALATAASGRLIPKVQRLAEQRLLERVAAMELAVLEDGRFHRSLAGARLGIRAIEQLVPTVFSAMSALVGVIAAISVIGLLHPLLIPLLVLSVVPSAWKAVAVARREYASALRYMTQARQKDLLVEMLVDEGAPAEEIRVHGLAAFLLGHYRRLAGALEAERTRLSRVEAGIGVLADAGAGVARVLVYVALGGLLVSGTVALATVGTMVYAMTRITAQLSSVLMQFNALYRHGLFVADYSHTLEWAAAAAITTGGSEPAGCPQVISLRDISFTYPGGTSPALDGVDLDLRRGEVIALVGANGSGKSTLARLIAGLYRPQSGTITWDGEDVHELDRDSVVSQIAWIGQNFQRWPFTVRANTILGRPTGDSVAGRLEAAAEFAGVGTMIADLPDGWETLLAREFEGGVNLSGGQWQRIALARASYRNAEILICDEPTAALDPLFETAVFDRLMALADRGQTVLLITHRMGSISRADRVYVLDAGQVVESGSHDELISRDGLFAEMYRKQRTQFDSPVPAGEPTTGTAR